MLKVCLLLLLLAAAEAGRRKNGKNGMNRRQMKVMLLDVNERLTEVEYQAVLNSGVASQSSTILRGYANLAIDGFRYANYNQQSCTHTKTENNPWWQETFSAKVKVSGIEIVNRKDCCGTRLDNLKVTVDGKWCGSYKRPAVVEDLVKIPCNGTLEGKKVKIEMEARGTLTMCEVIIV